MNTFHVVDEQSDVALKAMACIFDTYSEQLRLVVCEDVELYTENDILRTHTVDEMYLKVYHQLALNLTDISDCSFEKAKEMLTWIKLDSELLRNAISML